MKQSRSHSSGAKISGSVVYVAISVVHVASLAVQWDWLANGTKPLLMPVAMVAAGQLLRWRLPAAARWLMAALFFSWVGDCAGLVVPEAATLPVMLVSFGVAHGCFVVLFWRHLQLRRPPKAAWLLLVWWVAMLALVGPASGGLVVGLAGYGLLLAATTWAAVRCNRLIVAGGLCFLVSDSILAAQLFLQTPAWTSPAVMLTYTAAQGLFVWGTTSQLVRGRGAV